MGRGKNPIISNIHDNETMEGVTDVSVSNDNTMISAGDKQSQNDLDYFNEEELNLFTKYYDSSEKITSRLTPIYLTSLQLTFGIDPNLLPNSYDDISSPVKNLAKEIK